MIQEQKIKNYYIKNPEKLRLLECKAMTYIRVWDLTDYDPIMVKKYKLDNKEYVYVGESGEKCFKTRTSKWMHNLIYHPEKVEASVIKFYNRYKKMMIEEFEMSSDDFNDLFFYNSKVIIKCKRDKVASQMDETDTLNAFIRWFELKRWTVEPINSHDSRFNRVKGKKGIYKTWITDTIKLDIRNNHVYGWLEGRDVFNNN